MSIHSRSGSKLRVSATSAAAERNDEQTMPGGVSLVANDTFDNNYDDEEESIIELGHIALLGSSRASLRYRNELAQSAEAGLGKLKDSRSSKILPPSSRLLSASKEATTTAATATDGVVIGDDNVFLDDDALAGQHTLVEKIRLAFLPFKGYAFGILSAFSFCLSQVTMKRAKWLSGSDHSLMRYIVTLIIMATILKYKELSIFGPKRVRRVLIFRGLVGSIALISVSYYISVLYMSSIIVAQSNSCFAFWLLLLLIKIYFSIMFINPSDSHAIGHTSIVITAVLARVFLNEKITLAHFIALFLTIIGVLFISKPSFLFNVALAVSASSQVTRLADASVNCTTVDGVNSTTLRLDCERYSSQAASTPVVPLVDGDDADAFLSGMNLKATLGITLAFISKQIYLILMCDLILK